MAGNPLVDQGLLNRLSASVIWDDFTNLNVEPSSLGTAGIRLRLDGNASSQHRTMTGLVQSPEPYIPIEVVINLLKTQGLSDDYKTQMEATSLIGAGSVWPDVPVGEGGLTPYQLENMSIMSVAEQSYAGDDPVWAVTCRGFYVVNNNLWGV
jgi:hypothetical protein